MTNPHINVQHCSEFKSFWTTSQKTERPKETNSSRAYPLRLEDEQLSPCRISHKHLGTWQSHSSSNFHTENI